MSDVNRQLEFVWREFMTTEAGPFRRLMAAPDLKSATWAMQGFERPSGYNPGVVGSGRHWDQRLQAANQAMATFGSSVQASTIHVDQMNTGMGKLGTGMGQMSQGVTQFGGALGQILSGVAGSVGGAKGGILQTILGIGAEMSKGVPLFSSGGFTGAGAPDAPAGVVHKGEYVFDAAATRTIGLQNLEALRRGTVRGFRAGGYVGALPASAAPAGGGDAAASGKVNFSPYFDLRGAQDPDATEAAARRAMKAALAEFSRTALPGQVRAIVGKPRNAN